MTKQNYAVLKDNFIGTKIFINDDLSQKERSRQGKIMQYIKWKKAKIKMLR